MPSRTRSAAVEAKVSSATEEQQHITQNGDLFELPDFTMKQIHDAIPPHCLQPSILRSMAYVARDFTYFSILIYASSFIQFIPNVYARTLAWAAYTVIQGMVMTGIWILAHECGHGAFSKNKQLNNIMGLIMHSFVLVPFHSWRITHSMHHKSTGNIERELAFVPINRDQWVKKYFGKADPASLELSHLVQDAPLVGLCWCLLHQFLGWPFYLLFNHSGQKYNLKFPQVSHFYFGLDNPLFKQDQLPLVLLSDIGVGAMVVILGICVHLFGVWNVVVLYLLPYLWVNHWIVAITFLHHTDGSLPHYSNNAWTFTRGATATIDRNFGFIDTHLFHDIIGTHVCHHLISTIPFYHAREASRAIKKVMGKHYRADTTTPFMSAFWKNQRECKFVEETIEGSGVFFFRNLYGKGYGAPAKDLTGKRSVKETKAAMAS